MREHLTKIHARLSLACCITLIAAVHGCTTPPVTPEPAPAAPPVATTPSPPLSSPQPAPSPPATKPRPATPPRVASAPAESGVRGSPPAPTPPTSGVSFRPATWADLPGWRDDAVHE